MMREQRVESSSREWERLPAGRESPGAGSVPASPILTSVRCAPEDLAFTMNYPDTSPTSSTHPALPWRYELSTQVKGILVVCVLNAVLGFVFAKMFADQHISFALAAHAHGWDAQEKATACRKAGAGYAVTVLLIVMNPYITKLMGPPSSWWCNTKRNVRSTCRRFIPKERLSLLGYSRKGSDQSDDDDHVVIDEEMVMRAARRSVV